jgi:aminopeptidase
MDPRMQKLAKLLVRYSLDLKPGETVYLDGHFVSLPLITELYREGVRA